MFLFQEWLESMSFDVCHYNEFDGVYYEIWQRCTNEVSTVPWSSEQLSHD
jgi:hypothetical protein